jgi:hypothetical protein
VTERLEEGDHDFSALGDADFLGDAEDVTVRVIGEFDALVVMVIEALDVLELLGDTVPDLVIKELADSDTLTHELADGELVPDGDICEDSDAETDEESRLVIDGDPDTLGDS